MSGDHLIPQGKPRNSIRSSLAVSVVAVLLGMLVWRLILIVHGQRLGEHAAEALAILDGHAFSPAFMNRLLAPALLRALVAATGLAPGQALGAMILGLLVVTSVTWANLVLGLTGSVALSLRSTLFSAAGFTLLVDPLFLKPWDFIEYLTFTLFAWGVLAGARAHFFAIVFTVAIFNRESALFMAAWLIIAGLTSSTVESTSQRVRRAHIGLGAVLGLGGFGFVFLARRTLWSGAQPTGSMTPWGNHFELMDNVGRLAADVRSLNPESLFLLVIPAVAAWLFRARRSLAPATAALAIVLAGVAASNLCFAALTEARTWLVCIPMVVALDLHLVRASTAA